MKNVVIERVYDTMKSFMFRTFSVNFILNFQTAVEFIVKFRAFKKLYLKLVILLKFFIKKIRSL